MKLIDRITKLINNDVFKEIISAPRSKLSSKLSSKIFENINVVGMSVGLVANKIAYFSIDFEDTNTKESVQVTKLKQGFVFKDTTYKING